MSCTITHLIIGFLLCVAFVFAIAAGIFLDRARRMRNDRLYGRRQFALVVIDRIGGPDIVAATRLDHAHTLRYLPELGERRVEAFLIDPTHVRALNTRPDSIH